MTKLRPLTKDNLLMFFRAIVFSMGLNPLTMVQGKEVERLFEKEFGEGLLTKEREVK